MNILPPQKLDRLQERTECIRNLCVIAHVDHGKTSLVDCLISHNQIISEKRAGEEMYMDNTKTEQERLITMKSSSISLLYFDQTRKDPETPKPYLMHLIDSPGHIDFSSEVSAAVRVSDGALLVIDVIEGVSVQTKTVLRQAWEERMELCLVLNKIDRLVLQKKYKAIEAYEHIKNVLEQVNAVYASFAREESFKMMERKRNEQAQTMEEEEEEDGVLGNFKSMVISDAAVEIEDSEADEYFHPEKGNVVFTSAKDKWGFRVHDFAAVYAKKFKMSYNVLVKTLWGDFYLNRKEKKFYKKPQSASDVPLFVQFILRNIWRMYHITCITPDKEKVEADAKVLDITIPLRDLLRLREEPKLALHALLGKWLPIAPAVLSMAARCLPSPIKSQKNRIDSLWPSNLRPKSEGNEELVNSLGEENSKKMGALFEGCVNADPSAPLLAYVSKVLVYPKQKFSSSSMKVALPGVRSGRPSVPSPSLEKEEETDRERFVSFVRIYSGTLKKGDTIQILAREYDPLSQQNLPFIKEAKAEELFLLMGRELGPLDRICAGNVFGIGGISNCFNKFATISHSPVAPSLAPISIPVPLVRVALEPENPRHVKELDRALYQLSRADSSIEIFNEKAGEIIIATAGELHLDRCLDDLKDRYGISNVRVSNPIIPFKETVTDSMAVNKGPDDQIQESFAADKTVKICVKAEPIPTPLLKFFSSEKYRSTISRDTSDQAIKEIRELLQEECIRLKLPEKWIERAKNIWAVEPLGVGDNFLIGELPSSLGKIDLLDLNDDTDNEPKLPEVSQEKTIKKEIKQEKEEEEEKSDGEEKEFDWMEEIELKTCTVEEVKQQLVKMKAGILNGFRHSIDNGPLCGEPLTGVAIFVCDLEFYESKQEQRGYGTFSGQIMSAMSQGCRQALLVRSMRIVEPVYGCFLEVAQEVLGQATGLIRKRRGQILSDTMKEGTNWFELDAEIPVVESFGLCKELRNWSSGSVTIPSLVMKGWRQLEDDPFYVPRSEEDKEEWGDNFKFMANRAREIMNEVRKRKGVFIEKQLVESANKQRTLSKKK